MMANQSWSDVLAAAIEHSGATWRSKVFQRRRNPKWVEEKARREWAELDPKIKATIEQRETRLAPLPGCAGWLYGYDAELDELYLAEECQGASDDPVNPLDATRCAVIEKEQRQFKIDNRRP